MGLLLSVLITCVGVLEVIACYTHFRIGTAYNECKSNLRDVAKYYAVELRKHELHFEPGPEDGDPSTSQETLSELMKKRTVRIQEKSQHYSNGQTKNGNMLFSNSSTPGQITPNPAANLIVPRNSICGYDSPTVQALTPELNMTEAVEKMQNLDITRKTPSPYPGKTGLEVVERDFWRSRSPSPFPESKDSDSGVELMYSSGFKKPSNVSPLLENSDLTENFPHSPVEIVGEFWNKPQMLSQESWESTYSNSDLEVQNITGHMQRRPSPYPETLFGITAETAETEPANFDEAFLRSLDGVNRSSKCDDRRRSFKKKRNSSSTSSRASEISRSLTSLDDLDAVDKKSEIDSKKISPLTEEEFIDTGTHLSKDVNGQQIRTELVMPEKCESIASPVPEKSNEEATVTKQQQTLFQAKVAPNTSQQESSAPDKGKANLTFTEKVKDLEISVQLMVTVKGTSQGDKMEYTTTISQDDKSKKAVDIAGEKEEITRTTEEKSEYGNVKTSVTYGNSVIPEPSKSEPNLKDLQISSQSLIHAERTVLDDVASSEEEFLKLYESFTELPDGQKDQFLKIIGKTKPEIENVENIAEEPKVTRLEPLISSERNEDNITALSQKKIPVTEISETIIDSTKNVISSEKSTNKIQSRVDSTDFNTLNIDDKTDSKLITSTKECDQDKDQKTIARERSEVVEKQQIISQLSAEENACSKKTELELEATIKPKAIEEIRNSEELQESERKRLSCNKPETLNQTIIEQIENKSPSIIDNKSLNNEIATNCDPNLLIKQTEVENIQLKNQETIATIEEKTTPKLQTSNADTQEVPTVETETKITTTVLEPNEISTKIEFEIDKEPIEAVDKPVVPISKKDSITLKTKTNSGELTTTETNEKSTKTEKESSSESSSTPPTAIENKLRRASKTSFEDASSVQNQEMMKRRESNSEISPKQASQAFWVKIAGVIFHSVDFKFF